MNISFAGLSPKGKMITYKSDGMYDEHGNRIVMTNEKVLENLIHRLVGIDALHKPNHEDFISRCTYDGERYPCSTMRAGTHEEQL